MSPPPSPPIGLREVSPAALEHLRVLSQKMAEVSTEANAFSGRFLFGGIVAVLALLNTDLLVEKKLRITEETVWLVPILLVLVFALSGAYFYVVAERIRFLRRAYRNTKHKYEVTLYALLIGVPDRDFLAHLEISPKDAKATREYLRPSASFPETMAYLHSHHRQNYDRLGWRRDWWLAMTIVTLAIVIKVGLVLLTWGGPPAGAST